MSKVRDLKGQPFGRLRVLERAGSIRGAATWLCECQCGNFTKVLSSNLTGGWTQSCGCLRLEGRGRHRLVNREGQKFGKLKVLRRLPGFPTIWECRCDCGNTAKIRNTSWGWTQSCGCLRNILPSGIGLRNVILRLYKDNAQCRGYSWEISEEQFDLLTQGDCHYCGRPPHNTRTVKDYHGSFTYNGIDRKDPTLGYFWKNVVSCCKTCNYMKGELLYEEFFEAITRVHKKYKEMFGPR